MTIGQTDQIRKVTDGPGAPEDGAVPADAPARPVRYRSAPLPWRRLDMVICGLIAAGGVAGLVACWFGATSEVVWREQTGWLIGSIFCTGLVILGGGLWLLIGLRRVRQGFRDLRRDQRAAFGLTRARGGVTDPALEPTTEALETEGLVTAGQMTRVHKPSCLLLRGKQAVPVPPAELANYGRCGVCNS